MDSDRRVSRYPPETWEIVKVRDHYEAIDLDGKLILTGDSLAEIEKEIETYDE